jgi:chromosomal replication initiation ATPase DnaA
MSDRPRCLSINDVQRAVARAFTSALREILSRSELVGGRHPGPRRMAASFPRIGLAFARDHTSVIHACNVITRRCLLDLAFARMRDDITREVVAA